MFRGYDIENLTQDDLLGKDCPCQGCHKLQRSQFIDYSNQLGHEAMHNRICDAVLDSSLTFEKISALDIMSLWLIDGDLGSRLIFPAFYNESTKSLLECFRPKLRPLIIDRLIAEHKLVRNSSQRFGFKNLLNLILPISIEAVETVNKWIKFDAENRPLEMEAINKVWNNIDFKNSIDLINDPFETRWAAFWSDDQFKTPYHKTSSHYFDPKNDSENLIQHLRDIDNQKRNQFISTIPSNKLRWKRFSKLLLKPN